MTRDPCAVTCRECTECVGRCFRRGDPSGGDSPGTKSTQAVRLRMSKCFPVLLLIGHSAASCHFGSGPCDGKALAAGLTALCGHPRCRLLKADVQMRLTVRQEQGLGIRYGDPEQRGAQRTGCSERLHRHLPLCLQRGQQAHIDPAARHARLEDFGRNQECGRS